MERGPVIGGQGTIRLDDVATQHQPLCSVAMLVGRTIVLHYGKTNNKDYESLAS